jgi:hypothetical protein
MVRDAGKPELFLSPMGLSIFGRYRPASNRRRDSYVM